MNKNIFGFSFALLVLALAGSVTAASGCGDSAAALCDDICACQRCTSNDLDTCRSQADAAEQKAASTGCSSQFDDLVTCTRKNISCKGNSAVADGCQAEDAALSKCAKGSILLGGGDECTHAADHLAGCLDAMGSTSGSTTASCTGAALCSAGCFNAADCAAIKDAFSGMPTDASKSLIDCATKCASAK
jgi:hypothetical protein